MGICTPIFILYAPQLEDSGHYGPMFIKAGTAEAYAAFSTIELAELFIKFWEMPKTTIIIPANELGRSYPDSNSNIDLAVIFKTYEQLESYFRSPEQYPCSEYIESLGLL